MAKYKVTLERVYRTVVEVDNESTDVNEAIQSIVNDDSIFDKPNAKDWCLEEYDVRTVMDENYNILAEF